MRIFRVLSAVLVVAAVGCGREGAISSVSARGPNAAPTTTPTTADATTAPATTAPTNAPAATAAPSSAATTAPVASAPLSEAALQKTLLTAAELQGWTAGSTSGGGNEGQDDFEPCGKKADTKFAPTHEASADYNQGQLGDQLQLTNESHPSPAHAAANIKEAKDQIKSCPTWSETNDDGSKVTFTAKEAPFPNIADETAAFRIEFVVSGAGTGGQAFEVHGDGLAVGARLGPNIVGVFHMAIGINMHPELDTAETESIAREAVAKFKRTA